MIEDRGEYFLVEGDIHISKAAVRRLRTESPVSTLSLLNSKAAAQKQYNTDVIVGGSHITNMVVSLSGIASLPTWQTAARAAMVEWNNVPCSGVRFLEGSPADIHVVASSSGSPNEIARARFPADAATPGKPGDTIDVYTTFTGSPNTASTKKRNMAHELGHTIGYRHTNWNLDLPSSYGANHIAGTPNVITGDPASVMNGGTGGTGWNGFSTHDKNATATLYPMACLTGSTSYPNPLGAMKDCTFNISPTGGLGPYSISWYVSSIYSFSPTTGSGTSFTTRLYYTGSGYPTYTVTAAITDALGKTAYVTHYLTAAPEGQPYDYARCT